MEKQDELTRAVPPGVHQPIEYKWIALSVTTIGALMAAIDTPMTG
ncbi:MAG: hypothetical protein WCA79_01245 [Anaerolineales bacterium]